MNFTDFDRRLAQSRFRSMIDMDGSCFRQARGISMHTIGGCVEIFAVFRYPLPKSAFSMRAMSGIDPMASGPSIDANGSAADQSLEDAAKEMVDAFRLILELARIIANDQAEPENDAAAGVRSS